jgi:2-(1,2-epoxy-1,2-dihydrophenyl)acetyl-CoA isomerase
MSAELVLFECHEDVARVTLNRPERSNSFNVAMHLQLKAALQSAADAQARVLVLTGAGRAFCAGQDLTERIAVTRGEAVDLGESLERHYEPLLRTLRSLPMPVIAAVNGVAAGSGANVALACDLVIATESAKFIQPFQRLGLLPDCGGTWSLPRLVGHARAKGLALLGDQLPARAAAEWGLIWRCVADAEFQSAVAETSRKLALLPVGGIAAARRALDASWENTFEEQLVVERECQRSLGRTTDYADGVRAFFEKRTADSTRH